jgi:hypothetical protein
MDLALSIYVQSSVLNDYTTKASLDSAISTALGGYATTGSLSDYTKASDLTIKLSDYTTTSNLNSLLSEYVQNDDINSLIALFISQYCKVDVSNNISCSNY